ncbi:response regulator transcription factor [Trichlorobacter ammonificans]|uniref:Two component transcriptional regulator, winged helix family n=1 Tax=Trichlorobacter ammonificans TaxID=2916410 RepID=A0ABN8HBE4_9BACT|nr:response regulator transcription factor [Trichlorobacter ammonificans]CAH2029840.1 Two component transcriptional regulator, winged helix family [Trichlorobacter ammonificans]
MEPDRAANVLIVEDNFELRESMVEYLALAGFATVGVGSAAEFYKELDNDWSVVVVDVGLPDQSGYVLVEYIRNNTAMSVIILTARNAPEDRVRGYDAGADLYMAKPVDGRELVAAIHNVMQRRRERAVGAGDPKMPQPFQRHWALDRAAWQLVAPDGACIELTGKEMRFIELLATIPVAAATPVPRSSLLMDLYNRHDSYSSRALDALVRRLRGKVGLATGEAQPIKTVHAEGYRFSADLKVI